MIFKNIILKFIITDFIMKIIFLIPIIISITLFILLSILSDDISFEPFSYQFF